MSDKPTDQTDEQAIGEALSALATAVQTISDTVTQAEETNK